MYIIQYNIQYTCVNADSRRPPHTAKEKHPTERTLCFWGGKWGDFIGKSCISLMKGEGGPPGPKRRPRDRRKRYSDRSRQNLLENAPGREVGRFPWKKLHFPRERRGSGLVPAATGHIHPKSGPFRPTREGVRGIERNDILTDLVEIYWKMPPGRATTP